MSKVPRTSDKSAAISDLPRDQGSNEQDGRQLGNLIEVMIENACSDPCFIAYPYSTCYTVSVRSPFLNMTRRPVGLARFQYVLFLKKLSIKGVNNRPGENYHGSI